MATLSSNPSYQALAAMAASALGNPAPSIIKGILAQWQCELGNVSYPPTRNNPGNIARGFAQGVGIPFTVQFPNPQPSNPIVTYATPADGARAYAGGIRMFKRYALARTAVARGDGRGFILGLTAAGWGTNAGCALRVYSGERGTVSTDATLASATASSDAALKAQIDQLLQSLGISTDPNHVISAYESERLTLSGMFFSDAVGLEGKTVADLPRLARSFQASPGQQVQNAIADAIGAIPGALAGLAANLSVLVVILVLAYAGLRDILGGADAT